MEAVASVDELLELQATLEAITEVTHQLTGAETTALALTEVDGSLLVRAERGSSHSGEKNTVALDDAAVTRALSERGPVLIDHPSSGAPPLLAVPLIWRAETLGVVTVAFALPRVPGLRDVALVVALGNQAAVSVHFARRSAERAAQLDRLQQQLFQNQKFTALGRLVEGLAHEMNTPLNVVMTNLSVLGGHTDNLFTVSSAAQQLVTGLMTDPVAAARARPLQTAMSAADLDYALEDVSELLTDSTTAVGRVAELVRAMADFARLDTGQPSAVVVSDVLAAALTLASNPLKQCARVIRAFGPIPPVLGVRSELTELFVYLLVSAAEGLGKQRGEVTLTTSSSNGLVEISIRDTGRGFSTKEMDGLFDPFSISRPGSRCAGMGLAVAHAIVVRHNGSIAVDSSEAAGTTVTVRLPAAAPP